MRMDFREPKLGKPWGKKEKTELAKNLEKEIGILHKCAIVARG